MISPSTVLNQSGGGPGMAAGLNETGIDGTYDMSKVGGQE